VLWVGVCRGVHGWDVSRWLGWYECGEGIGGGGWGGGTTIKLAKNCRWPVPAYLHVLRTHVNKVYYI